MKHRFEVSARAEVGLAALDEGSRKALLEWTELLLNGIIEPRRKVRELSLIPHLPRWRVAEFSPELFVFFRALSDAERAQRGGIDPSEFLIRCVSRAEELNAEVNLLLSESGVRREAEMEAETEAAEEAAEALARAEREEEDREPPK